MRQLITESNRMVKKNLKVYPIKIIYPIWFSFDLNQNHAFRGMMPKLLNEDWEGALEDQNPASLQSPQVCSFITDVGKNHLNVVKICSILAFSNQIIYINFCSIFKSLDKSDSNQDFKNR